MIDLEKLRAGDLRTLSKAITLIESSKNEDQVKAQELLKNILPYTGKSFRLGITGSPGVGKSTFIENFGQHLIAKGHKIAVLAIDPSSPTSGGSILGDKTRMEKLATEKNAFIRPTPTSGTLGGVAQKTRETILLCEAAGFDFIVIETVGVGQSEYEVANMVDFFLLMILPSGGMNFKELKKAFLNSPTPSSSTRPMVIMQDWPLKLRPNTNRRCKSRRIHPFGKPKFSPTRL